jgi:hypothetical protein
MEDCNGSDSYVLLQIYHLGCHDDQPWQKQSSIAVNQVITHTISHFTSSCMEKNTIFHHFQWKIVMDLTHMYCFRYIIRMSFMMTLLGNNNHPLPSIRVIRHTISHFTSSCMETNMITLLTTSNGILSWI